MRASISTAVIRASSAPASGGAAAEHDIHADVARKVIGVGSVGTEALIVLGAGQGLVDLLADAATSQRARRRATSFTRATVAT
jgi:hypothetical protein